MKIKVSSSYTGVISTGSYENARPAFSAEIEEDINPQCKETDLAEYIKVRQEALQTICYDRFKACEHQAIIERVEKDRKDIRWYGENGNRVPSVTSIINFDADMWVTQEELQQYASQGQIIHAQVAHYIKTGKWVEPKELSDVWSDLVIVTKGGLKLPLNGWDFPAFLKKYPITNLKNCHSSVNTEHKYGGTPDLEGTPEIKGVDGVPTLCDVKRTPDKVKNFKQISAYCKMKGYEHIKQMMVIPINDKTQQGFSKPIIETRIDEYFKMFLKDREAFRNRFGV